MIEYCNMIDFHVDVEYRGDLRIGVYLTAYAYEDANNVCMGSTTSIPVDEWGELHQYFTKCDSTPNDDGTTRVNYQGVLTGIARWNYRDYVLFERYLLTLMGEDPDEWIEVDDYHRPQDPIFVRIANLRRNDESKLADM